MPTITGFRTIDVRFPTSRGLHGSDAMNPDPDYSGAYLLLETDVENLAGHGLVFTIGRGNDLQCAAIALMAPAVVGEDVATLEARIGDIGRQLVRDSQIRWLGPEKGIPHMAAGAVINALWDIVCKLNKKPLWKQLADMTPEALVNLVDFRHIDDALTPEEALGILRAMQGRRAENEQKLLTEGCPAYTTTPGWIGYTDEVMVQRAHEALDAGFTLIKMKVGRSLENDIHRLSLMRKTIGPNVRMAVDANQVWGVKDAIEWIKAIAPYDLYWVEEPTSPDEILGHATIAKAIAPTRVATGEHVHNRIIFKQMMQAGSLSFCQIDATRVAGVNENVAIILMAAKFGIPVCPHAGGVALCEMVQHLAMFDMVAVSGPHTDRSLEYAAHLHEHFVVPVEIQHGSYVAPRAPGGGAELVPDSLASHTYPTGSVWQAILGTS